MSDKTREELITELICLRLDRAELRTQIRADGRKIARLEKEINRLKAGERMHNALAR